MFSTLIQDFIETKAKEAISENIGIDPNILKNIDSDIVGSILGGLTNNAKKGDANNILNALDKDHDGSILDDIGSLTKNPQAYGESILKHVLGNKRKNIETYITENYGLSPAITSSLMDTAAPLVMAFLSKQVKETGMDATQLTQFLEKEEQTIKEDPNNNTNPLLAFLDKDGDGDVDIMDLI